MSVEEGEAIYETAEEPVEGSGVSVDAGGQLGSKISKSESKTSELIGIAAAMLILVLVFGTVTAMVLPIAAAIFGLICGLSLVSLLGHLVAVPDVAPTVGAMIGLGVGIDYSLFIVTRARSARHEGMSAVDAIGHAAATSGSAVAFAGITVVIALLVARRLRHHADHRARPGRRDRRRRRRARLDDAAAGPARPLRRPHRAAAHRPRQAPDARPQRAAGSAGARGSSRRPGVFALVSVLLLLVLSAPVSSLELGLTDQSSAAKSTTSRQAYDLMTENFGAGSNGPLLVTANTGDKRRSSPSSTRAWPRPRASPPSASRRCRKDGTAAMINVIPEGSPSVGRDQRRSSTRCARR